MVFFKGASPISYFTPIEGKIQGSAGYDRVAQKDDLSGTTGAQMEPNGKVVSSNV